MRSAAVEAASRHEASIYAKTYNQTVSRHIAVCYWVVVLTRSDDVTELCEDHKG